MSMVYSLKTQSYQPNRKEGQEYIDNYTYIIPNQQA